MYNFADGLKVLKFDCCFTIIFQDDSKHTFTEGGFSWVGDDYEKRKYKFWKYEGGKRFEADEQTSEKIS